MADPIIPPTWEEIEASPEFKQAAPRQREEALKTWKSDILNLYKTDYVEGLDDFVGQKLTDINNAPIRDLEGAGKILVYGMASGTMGITQAVKSGELQAATNLPASATLVLGALIDRFTLGSEAEINRKVDALWSGDDAVRSAEAKRYVESLRTQLNDLNAATSNVRQLAKDQGGDLSNEVLFGVGAVGPQLAAIIPASASATLLGGPTAGLTTAAALSGLQSETAVFDEARRAYKATGMTDEEAESAAYLPASLAGGATAALTFIFPGGAESIRKAVATRAGQLVVKGAVRQGFMKSVGSLGLGIADEATEEFIDQFTQGVIARYTYDPDKPWGEIAEEAGIAGLVGGVAGGSVNVAGQVLSRGAQEQSPVDELNQIIESTDVSKLPTLEAIVDEAAGELITPEALQPMTDEQLQTDLQVAAQSRPEAARAIQEELDRRNIQSTVELPPEQATEDLNTIPTAEGDLISDFNLQMEQPVSAGEVVSGEDLIQQVQNNEQDIQTQEQVQGEQRQGEAPTKSQVEAPEASPEDAIRQNRIAENLQDLRPQLVERARRAGVEDPEAVAQDAILKASTAQTEEEARRFANSTAIQQSVSDALRKQKAQGRQAQAGAISMQEETETGTVGESIAADQTTPAEDVQRNEQRSILETNRDEFYSTLNPKEQELWHKINTPGTGRAPTEAQIQTIAKKFSNFLKQKGYRNLGNAIESKAVPPKGWKPNSTEKIVKLTQDYSLDKGLDSVLDSISRRSQTPYKRYLARILRRQQGREIGVVPRNYGKWRPYDGLFGYDKGQPSIILNMSNIKDADVLENVILHENIHGQTLDLIDIYNESPDLLTANQKKTLDNLNGLLNTARKEILGAENVEKFLRDVRRDPAYFTQEANRPKYGLMNLEEFVSETMSNVEFQEMLKGIQVPGEGVSMWTKVVEFLKELLQITTPNTAAEKAFENILALVDEGKRFAQLEGRIPPLKGRSLTPAMMPSIAASTIESDISKREQEIKIDGKTYELDDTGERYIEITARKATGEDLNMRQEMALLVGRGMENFKPSTTPEEYAADPIKAFKKSRLETNKEALRLIKENFTKEQLENYKTQFNTKVSDLQLAGDAYADWGSTLGDMLRRNQGILDMTKQPPMSPTAVSATPTGMTLPSKVKEAMEWTAENLRARGKFNDPIFQEMLKKDQKGAAIMNKVEKDVQELKALIGSGPVSTFRRKLRGQTKEKVDPATVDLALKGDQTAFSALPESVQEVINSMRANLDYLSQQLIDSGMLSEELAATVEKNLGVYLNRSYEIFDNPKYKEQALNNPAFAQTIDDARAYLRKYILADHAVGYAKEQAWANRAQYGIKSTLSDDPTWQAFEQTQEYQDLIKAGAQDGLDKNVATDDEVEKEVFRLLDIAAKEGMNAFSSGIPGRKNRNILKRRKDVPVEIRNLWGEYKDPFVNYVRSASKTASLITNHKFLSNVAAQGLNEGWLFREDDPNRPPETVPVISKDPQNKALDPLAGLYGDEKLREAFAEFADRTNNAWWVRAFSGLTGLSMASKTILSVQSTVRNFMGNILFGIGNGYISPSNIGNLAKASKALEANLLGLTQNRKQWQEYVQHLIEIGIVGESVSGNTLRELIQKASRGKSEENMAETMANDMLSKGRAGFVLAGKLYQSVDDFWKIYAFESEKARYGKAFPELSEAQLEQKVAKIVRDVLPTYSLAPQIIQKLRKFPFMAPFITFTSEVVRVAYNTLRLGIQEVQDPKTRSIGISRLAGAATASLFFPTIGMVMKEILGFDDDDEDALRELLPDWQKNAELILTGKDGKGKISYIDVSYLNPYGYLKQPFVALGRSQSPSEALGNTLQAVFSPIFSEQILAGALTDVARNKKANGGEVYNPQASWSKQAMDSAAHIWEAFEPGVITSLERIRKAAKGYVEKSGRSYKLGNEVASVTLGNRISETDANQGLQQAARRFKRESREATTIFTSEFKSRGTVTEQELINSYQEAAEARRNVFLNIRKAYDAAINLGVSPEAAKRALKGEELSVETINQIVKGILKPYEVSEDVVREAKETDPMRKEVYDRIRPRESQTLLK